MGISYETFLRLTPQQFQIAYDDFRLKVESDREANELLAYSVARWAAWRQMCPPAKKNISVMDLITLPGDEEYKKQTRKKIKPGNRARFEYLKKRWGNGN